ncbi:hypothetical protein EDB80DRAFT_721099 [Ilyonectria destructans]|nr:hypothetical protein EDB80DRAFT_721099 [Ilyonectria destructans]
MFKPDSRSKIDLLLAKADKLQATLSTIETFIETKINPGRRSARSVGRGKRNEDQNEPPAWAKSLTDLLNTVREEAQAIQSDAQAIAAQSHDASGTSSEVADASANGNPALNLTLPPDPQSESHTDSEDGDATTSSEQEQAPRHCDPEPDDQVSRASQPAMESRAGGNSPNEDTPMTDGEQLTRGLVSEDVVMVDSSEGDATGQPLQARSVEGGSDASLAVASHQPAQLLTTPDPIGQEDTRAPDGTASRDSDTVESTTSAADTTDTRITTPDIDSAQSLGSVQEFVLSSADMGEQLIQTLQNIVTRDDFDNEIIVPRPNIDLDSFKAKLNTKDRDCQYAGNTFEPGPEGEGYAFVYISERTSDFKWPDFSNEVKLPTIAEARKWLDDVVSHPPEDTVPYYSGHAFDVPYETPLNPGPEILADPDLADLHHPYYHIGGDKSANRFHFEDLSYLDNNMTPGAHGLRSANMVLAGVKLWILIAMHHTKKFEEFITTNWKCNECSQGIGHRCLLISPSRLEKEGIDFDIKIAGPGQMIVPHLCQYHAVANMGPCIAQSINFKLPGDKLISKELRCCSWCGVSAFTSRHNVPRVPSPVPSEPTESTHSGEEKRTKLPEKPHRKRKAREELPRRIPKTRTSTAATERWAELRETILAADPCCNLPQVVNEPSAQQLDVLKMVASIRSSEAIQQFTDLVRDWRCRDVHVVISDDAGDLLQQQVKRLKAAIGRSSLSKLELRYAQLCVAREVDQDKQGRSRLRRSKASTEALAKRLEMDHKELKSHLEDGRMWNSICGSYDGLLPFVLLDSKKSFYISKKEWRGLRDEQLKAFQDLLDDDDTENMCRAGKTFQEIMTKGSNQVFRWEEEKLDPKTKDRTSLLWRTIR